MNLGMQAIADEIRNSTEVAPDGLEGGSADEREDVSVGTEPVGNTVIEETPPVNGAAVPEAKHFAYSKNTEAKRQQIRCLNFSEALPVRSRSATKLTACAKNYARAWTSWRR